MEKNKIMTNREIQEELSSRIRSLEDGAEASHVRTYFVGARTLLTAVKMDIETAKSLGTPLYKRTKQFLEIE